MRILLPAFSLIMILSLFLFSCDKKEVKDIPSEGSENLAQLELYLTDAPGDLKEIRIDIRKIKVRIDTAYSDDADAGIWQELPLERASDFNLLGLRNGTDTLIASGEVNAGRLREIQLDLGDDNSVVTNNGEDYLMTAPDQIRSDAKLTLDPYARTASDENTARLVLDFDILKSVQASFDPDDSSKTVYMFTPYTRTFSRDGGGAIEGWVLPGEAEATVIAIDSDKDSLFTNANPDGYFKLWGLQQGNYTLKYQPDASSGYQGVSQSGIQINQGALITIDTVKLIR